MARQTLTDRQIKSLKPRGAGPYIQPDPQVPGHGVRVMPSGRCTFVLSARYPGSKHPVPRALGAVGELTLEKARAKARKWREQIAAGIDPQEHEAEQRRAEERQRGNTFAVVAEAFIRDKVLGAKCYAEWQGLEWATPPQQHAPLERKGLEVARDIRRDLIPLWGRWPIAKVTNRDIRDAIKAKMEAAPAQARNLLGIIKRLFSWAVDEDCYGLDASPADALKPGKLVGDKVSGQRILSDAELFALCRAAERTPYPHGSVYQVLILTALRLNEAADASWAEFDISQRIWTVPASRMKGKNGKARPHAVPLTDELIEILQKLPRFKTGDYLFSTAFGEKPVWMSDKVKKRIDKRMLRTLRALARQRGDDPAKIKLTPWTNHDIRRTVRSRLSRLKITEEAREAVLAHARPGIKGTYDLYDYLDEKREALTLWKAHLRSIVEPPPTNVIQFGGKPVPASA
jgi:integrase